MTASDIFIAPGEFAVLFALTVLGLPEDAMQPAFFAITSFLLALYTWVVAIRIAIAILLRLSGFDRRGPQR